MTEQPQPLWPAEFPADCPPLQAGLPGGAAFRFVRTSPASDSDFQSHAVRFPNRRFDDPCEACGLSVYEDLASALRAQRRVPAMKKKFVAAATLGPAHGQIMDTPRTPGDGHCTWWPPVGLAIPPLFTVVAQRMAP